MCWAGGLASAERYKGIPPNQRSFNQKDQAIAKTETREWSQVEQRGFHDDRVRLTSGVGVSTSSKSSSASRDRFVET